LSIDFTSRTRSTASIRFAVTKRSRSSSSRQANRTLARQLVAISMLPSALAR
jgi:hypothetical protein